MIRKIEEEFHTALYIRLSREDGDKEESNSVINQKNMLGRYVGDQNDLSLYDFYIDDGFSGTNFDRPNFKRMIRDIRDKKINCVIVKDLSRFGRDYIETGRYIERFFVEYNIRFISINDHIDSLYSQYDMLMPIKNIFNQQYALDISQKVQSSFKIKQREGQFIGAFPSYGYKKDPTDKHILVIDEAAAIVVRRIFSLYARGTGKQGIAKVLNFEGILCPSAYKSEQGMNYHNSNKLVSTKYWTYSTINHILHNQMYIGNMVQGKTKRRMKGKAYYLPQEAWIVVKKKHPAIIDNQLWEQVQQNLKRDIRYVDYKKNISIFAGVLKCGDCGRSLSKNQNLGQTHYVCASYKNYGKNICSSHRINQNVLEEIVLKDLNQILLGVDNLKELIREEIQKKKMDKKSVIIKEEEQSTRTQIQRLTTQKRMAYQDYREDLISKEEYIDYKKNCERKIAGLERRKNMIEMELGTELGDEFGSLWIKKLNDKGKVDKLDRSIVIEMVNQIYIYEDKRIQITYRYCQDIDKSSLK